VGFLNELIWSGVCSSWSACVWELSRHPLLIAIVAWRLAAWYQTRSKRLELRVNILRDAAAAYFKGAEMAVTHMLGKPTQEPPPRVVAAPGVNIHLRLPAGGGLPPGHLTQCAALEPIVDQAFSTKVLDQWKIISNSLADAMGESDASKIEELVMRAARAYVKFVAQAGKEVGARPLWRRTSRGWLRLKARFGSQRSKK